MPKILPEVWQAIRGAVVGHVGVTIATLLVAAIVAGATSMWAFLKQWQWLRVDVPKNAVLAFAGPCPEGWEKFRPATSRTIVGAGDAGDMKDLPNQYARGADEKPLTARPLLEPGGSENHVLTESEMPRHAHQTGIYHKDGVPGYVNPNEGGNSLRMAYDWRGTGNAYFVTDAKGGDQPHNNMQPYIALNYCKQRG